jgi:DNA-binding response OmpR family regulator
MKLLIVEDESRLAKIVQQGLQTAGYEVDIVDTAEKALVMSRDSMYDCFIIDVMLPGMDGLQLCRDLRDQGIRVPMLLLTARDTTADKIAGLDAGADDYLTKPFEFDEFNARVRALLRKGKGYERPAYRVADLVIDPNQRRVMRGAREITLSRKEYALLEFLARNQGHLVTRPMISHSVWDNDTSTYTNIIDVFIATLRKKVDCEGEAKLIHTVRGRGFMLSDTAGDQD